MTAQVNDEVKQQSPTRVCVLGSSRIRREALCQLLLSIGFEAVEAGMANSGGTCAPLSGTRPMLLLQSLTSVKEAEELSKAIAVYRARYPNLMAVVLTDCSQPALVVASIHANVEAVLSDDVSCDVLRRSLELVLLGQKLFPADLAHAFLPRRTSDEIDVTIGVPRIGVSISDMGGGERRRLGRLSKRELEILRCLVAGMSNKIIARTLDITEATVKVHIKGVLRKTQLENRTQVAIWALNHNIIDSLAPIGPGSFPKEHVVVSEALRQRGVEQSGIVDAVVLPPDRGPRLC